MNDGVCRIFVSINEGAWQKFKDIKLNADGNYQESHSILTSGQANFVAICCDSTMTTCKMSNQELLIVNVCGDEDSSEDEESYTCGVTSYCIGGTCPTGYACQEISSVEVTWCGCVNSNNEVHPDWKPDGENYNPN